MKSTAMVSAHAVSVARGCRQRATMDFRSGPTGWRRSPIAWYRSIADACRSKRASAYESARFRLALEFHRRRHPRRLAILLLIVAFALLVCGSSAASPRTRIDASLSGQYRARREVLSVIFRLRLVEQARFASLPTNCGHVAKRPWFSARATPSVMTITAWRDSFVGISQGRTPFALLDNPEIFADTIMMIGARGTRCRKSRSRNSTRASADHHCRNQTTRQFHREMIRT